MCDSLLNTSSEGRIMATHEQSVREAGDRNLKAREMHKQLPDRKQWIVQRLREF